MICNLFGIPSEPTDISIEQIVAVPYADDEAGNKRYLIIEDNRRVASLTTLLADNLAGAVDLADDIKKTLEEIPVVVLLGTEEEIASYQQTLMAIRHVAGIREWVTRPTPITLRVEEMKISVPMTMNSRPPP